MHNGDVDDCIRYVYREISELDLQRLQAGLGLIAKAPGGSIADQVAGRATRYISASNSIAATGRYSSGYGLIAIDVRKAIGGGSGFVDHNNVLQALGRNGRPIDVIHAARDVEVMFKGLIPFDAIKIIQ